MSKCTYSRVKFGDKYILTHCSESYYLPGWSVIVNTRFPPFMTSLWLIVRPVTGFPFSSTDLTYLLVLDKPLASTVMFCLRGEIGKSFLSEERLKHIPR